MLALRVGRLRRRVSGDRSVWGFIMKVTVSPYREPGSEQYVVQTIYPEGDPRHAAKQMASPGGGLLAKQGQRPVLQQSTLGRIQSAAGGRAVTTPFATDKATEHQSTSPGSAGRLPSLIDHYGGTGDTPPGYMGDRRTAKQIQRYVSRSMTGLPPATLKDMEAINGLSAQLAQMDEPAREAYTIRALNLLQQPSAACSAGLAALDAEVSQEVRNIAQDPARRVAAMFNAPVGTGYLPDRGRRGLSRLHEQYEAFVAPGGSEATRSSALQKAAGIRTQMQSDIAQAVAAQGAVEQKAWDGSAQRVNRILDEAGRYTAQNLRLPSYTDDQEWNSRRAQAYAQTYGYQSIGEKLLSDDGLSQQERDNPGWWPETAPTQRGPEEKARDLLTFQQGMNDANSALFKRVHALQTRALQTLTANGDGEHYLDQVSAPKTYADIQRELPEADGRYVSKLAGQYQQAVQDMDQKSRQMLREHTPDIWDQIRYGFGKALNGVLPLPGMDWLAGQLLDAAVPGRGGMSSKTEAILDTSLLFGGLLMGGLDKLPLLKGKFGLNEATQGALDHLHPVDGMAEPSLPQAATERIASVLGAGEPAGEARGAGLPIPESYEVARPKGHLEQRISGESVDARGDRYIEKAGRWYRVRYDADNGTLRVYSPTDASRPAYPVRLGADGQFEVHGEVGLKGGMVRAPTPFLHVTVPIGDETRPVQLNTGNLPVPSYVDRRDVNQRVGNLLHRSATDALVMPQALIAGPQRGWCAGCVFEAFGRKANGSATSITEAGRQMLDEYFAGRQSRQKLQTSIAGKQAMGGWYDLSREPGNYIRYPGNSIATTDARSLISDLRQGFAFPNDPRAMTLDAHGIDIAGDPDNQRRFVMVALDAKSSQMNLMGPPGQEVRVSAGGHALGIERAYLAPNYRDDTYRIYEPNVGVFSYRNFDQMAYALQNYYNASAAWSGGNEYVHWKTSYYGERSIVSVRAGAEADSVLLHRAVSDWGKSLSPTEAEHVINVTRASNVGQFVSLRDFAHEGDGRINDDLRSGHAPGAEARQFLADLEQVRPYRGESYRAVQLTPDALWALQTGQGKTFFDDGIQTSSVALSHAEIWSGVLGPQYPDRQPALIIFDRTVPQKNISTPDSPGTVAVEPGTPLMLKRILRDRNMTFIEFGAAPASDGQRIRIDDGKAVAHSTV